MKNNVNDIKDYDEELDKCLAAHNVSKKDHVYGYIKFKIGKCGPGLYNWTGEITESFATIRHGSECLSDKDVLKYAHGFDEYSLEGDGKFNIDLLKPIRKIINEERGKGNPIDCTIYAELSDYNADYNYKGPYADSMSITDLKNRAYYKDQIRLSDLSITTIRIG